VADPIVWVTAALLYSVGIIAVRVFRSVRND
jgi:hypothetical protein